MQFFVDTYQCEWPRSCAIEKRRLFKQFINTDATEPTIEFVKEREQSRPADWSASFVPVGELRSERKEMEMWRKKEREKNRMDLAHILSRSGFRRQRRGISTRGRADRQVR